MGTINVGEAAEQGDAEAQYNLGLMSHMSIARSCVIICTSLLLSSCAIQTGPRVDLATIQRAQIPDGKAMLVLYQPGIAGPRDRIPALGKPSAQFIKVNDEETNCGLPPGTFFTRLVNPGKTTLRIDTLHVLAGGKETIETFEGIMEGKTYWFRVTGSDLFRFEKVEPTLVMSEIQGLKLATYPINLQNFFPDFVNCSPPPAPASLFLPPPKK